MSQENVERIRSALSFEELEGFVTELLHRDVEWHDQRELPGATVHHGIEAVKRHLAAAKETLDYDTLDLVEIVDAGGCVVAAYRFYAHGRSSGAPVERDAVFVYTFRAAKVERVEIFGTRADALKAVGLAE